MEFANAVRSCLRRPRDRMIIYIIMVVVITVLYVNSLIYFVGAQPRSIMEHSRRIGTYTSLPQAGSSARTTADDAVKNNSVSNSGQSEYPFILPFGSVFARSRGPLVALTQEPPRTVSEQLGGRRHFWEWYSERSGISWSNVAHNGVIIFTLVDHTRLRLALNWVASLRRVGIEEFLVVCTDDEAYYSLRQYGLKDKTVLVGSKRPATNMEYRRHKASMILRLLDRDLKVLFSDVNAIFLSSKVVEFILAENAVPIDVLYMTNRVQNNNVVIGKVC
jgi:hypothetical protein